MTLLYSPDKGTCQFGSQMNFKIMIDFSDI